MSNLALDLIGQARGLLTRAGELEGAGRDEDQLAFLREERHYFNPVLMELPRGDFAFTQLRNAGVAIWLSLLWNRLLASTDCEVAAIAAKAVKEVAYHRQHACDWVVRLGDGTQESATRMKTALQGLWPYFNELFESDAVDEAAAAQGLGPAWRELQDDWLSQFGALLQAARLAQPEVSAYRSGGRRGVHSEHMGVLLAQLQYLQRAYPGGVW